MLAAVPQDDILPGLPHLSGLVHRLDLDQLQGTAHRRLKFARIVLDGVGFQGPVVQTRGLKNDDLLPRWLICYLGFLICPVRCSA